MGLSTQPTYSLIETNFMNLIPSVFSWLNRPSAKPTTTRHRVLSYTTASLVAASLSLVTLHSAQAIQPQIWTHDTEADFESGTTDNTIVSNLGEIKLAADIHALGELPEAVTVIYDIATIGDTTYIAAGPEFVLLKMAGVNADSDPDEIEVEEVVSLTEEQVFAMKVIDGELMLAISGADTRIAKLVDNTLETVVGLPDVRYVWDMVFTDDNNTAYLATGIDGQVHRLDLNNLDDGPELILDTEQDNVLCLALDQDGRLYAGTDTDGLIYRISFDNAGNATPFVVYDAPQPEIGDILVASDGMVYAATADANQAKPGKLTQSIDELRGRPDDSEPEDSEESDEPGDIAGEVIEEAAADDAGATDESGMAGETPMPMAEAATEEDADAAEVAGMEETEAAEAEAVEVVSADQPSQEQRDRLRDAVKERLMEARDSGRLQVARGNQAAPVQQAQASQPRSRPRQQASNVKGNAIYQIDRDGFVVPIFSESVMILALAEDTATGNILAATGNEGQVYRVDPVTEETVVVADLDGQQISTIHTHTDGSYLLGSANPAGIVAFADQIADEGTYESDVLDAEQISLWGTAHIVAELPEGSRLRLQTRSGNVIDPETAANAWSDWTDAVTFRGEGEAGDLMPREVKIESPPARFLQYKFTLKAFQQASPIVNTIDLAYVMPNLRPKIESIKAEYNKSNAKGNQPAPANPIMKVEWKAEDPNGDPLAYRLEYQPAGSDRWLLIAKDISNTNFNWDTRRVPDGRYTLRVTASDAQDNPASMARTARRVSDPVIVDNAAPQITGLTATVNGNGKNGTVTISGSVADDLDRITGLAYILNSGANDNGKYRPIVPEDLILDSTNESFSVTLRGSPSGAHVVTIRTHDARGNLAYDSVLFTVD